MQQEHLKKMVNELKVISEEISSQDKETDLDILISLLKDRDQLIKKISDNLNDKEGLKDFEQIFEQIITMNSQSIKILKRKIEKVLQDISTACSGRQAIQNLNSLSFNLNRRIVDYKI